MSLSKSLVVRPEDKVLITDGSGRWFTITTLLGSSVNPPAANLTASGRYFFGAVEVGWGKNCKNHRNLDQGIFQEPRFGTWDGFAPRIAGRGNVAYIDGHIENMSPEELAVGTNFGPGVSCNDVRITNPAIYKWDPLH